MEVSPLFSQNYYDGVVLNDPSQFNQDLYRLEAERQNMLQQVAQQRALLINGLRDTPPKDYKPERAPKSFREELQAETDEWLK